MTKMPRVVGVLLIVAIVAVVAAIGTIVAMSMRDNDSRANSTETDRSAVQQKQPESSPAEATPSPGPAASRPVASPSRQPTPAEQPSGSSGPRGTGVQGTRIASGVTSSGADDRPVARPVTPPAGAPEGAETQWQRMAREEIPEDYDNVSEKFGWMPAYVAAQQLDLTDEQQRQLADYNEMFRGSLGMTQEHRVRELRRAVAELRKAQSEGDAELIQQAQTHYDALMEAKEQLPESLNQSYREGIKPMLTAEQVAELERLLAASEEAGEQ